MYTAHVPFVLQELSNYRMALEQYVIQLEILHLLHNMNEPWFMKFHVNYSFPGTLDTHFSCLAKQETICMVYYVKKN
jgi:hypothetical protein